MMKYWLLTFSIFLLFLHEAFSQLYRVTNPNNEPIPHVSVYDINSEKWDVTDDTGLFRAVPGSMVIFSSLGYSQDTVHLASSNHTSLIILKRKSEAVNSNVEALALKAPGKKTFRSGNVLKKKEDYFYLARGDLSLVTKINNPVQKNAIIQEVFFNLKIDDSYPIRLRILSIDPGTGKPNEDLLMENVIVNELNLIGNYRVDISEFQVVLPPEGVFIGFDILPIGNMEALKIKIGTSKNNGKSESYIGPILINRWTLFNTRIKNQKPKGNFMFGVKARY